MLAMIIMSNKIVLMHMQVSRYFIELDFLNSFFVTAYLFFFAAMEIHLMNTSIAF